MQKEIQKLITIGISRETWTELNMKRLPGETWDSILNRLCLVKPVRGKKK
jgi:hypothetical protein